MGGRQNAGTAPALRKRSYHHGDLRAGLIEAARQLVEEKGPDGFSMSDACRLAGVSTAAPYKHFKDKTELLVAVCLEGMTRLRDNMDMALEGLEPGDRRRVQRLGHEYVRFAMAEHGVFRLKFGGFTDHLDDPRLEESGQACFGIVLREVARCMGEAEVTEEVRRRGFMLWSMVHGLSFLMYDEKLAAMGGTPDLDGLLDELGERVLG
ncbi:MAG: TetR/AcrR family transcriptional regulator [Pseudomonadota bacterium]